MKRKSNTTLTLASTHTENWNFVYPWPLPSLAWLLLLLLARYTALPLYLCSLCAPCLPIFCTFHALSRLLFLLRNVSPAAHCYGHTFMSTYSFFYFLECLDGKVLSMLYHHASPHLSFAHICEFWCECEYEYKRERISVCVCVCVCVCVYVCV